MITLTAIIVEDIPETRKLIRYGIEKFNQLSDIKFTIIGEAYSYETAEELILQEESEITLVLLDIGLMRKRRDGLDLMKRFPDLSYALITEDSQAITKAVNSLANPNIHFFQTKYEGSPDLDELVNGLDKFVREKSAKGELYARKFRVKNQTIYFKKVAVISTEVLCLQPNLILDQCIDAITPKGRVHFYSNIVDDNENTSLRCYEDKVLAMQNLIQELKLDPKNYIQISQSRIVNLNYVKDFLEDSNTLILDLLHKETHVKAKFLGVPGRLKNDVVIDKINNHI